MGFKTKTIISVLLISLLFSCSIPKENKEIILVTRTYSIYNVQKINDYLQKKGKNYAIKVIDLSDEFIKDGVYYNPSIEEYSEKISDLGNWDLVQTLSISPYEVNKVQTIESLNLKKLSEFDFSLSSSYPKEIVVSNRVKNDDFILPGFSLYSYSGKDYAYIVNEKIANEAGVDVSLWGDTIFEQIEDLKKIYDYYDGEVELFGNQNSLSFIFPNLTPINNDSLSVSPFVYDEKQLKVELLYNNTDFIKYASFFKRLSDLGMMSFIEPSHSDPLVIFNPSSLGIYYDKMIQEKNEYIPKGEGSIYINRHSSFGIGVNKNSSKLEEVEDFLNLYMSDKELNDIIIFDREFSPTEMFEKDYYFGYGNIYASMYPSIEEITIKNKGYMFNKSLVLSDESWTKISQINEIFSRYSLTGNPFWEIDLEGFINEIKDIELEDLIHELENQ